MIKSFRFLPHTLALTMLMAIAIMPVYSQEAAVKSWVDVVPGVTHLHHVVDDGPWNINVLKVDYSQPGILVRTVIGKDAMYQGETVKSAVKRLIQQDDYVAIGGSNGDFWASNVRMFSPIGLSVSDGMINNMPSSRRSIFAVGDSGQPYIGTVSVAVSLTDSKGSNFRISHINSLMSGVKQSVLYTGNYQRDVAPAS